MPDLTSRLWATGSYQCETLSTACGTHNCIGPRSHVYVRSEEEIFDQTRRFTHVFHTDLEDYELNRALRPWQLSSSWLGVLQILSIWSWWCGRRCCGAKFPSLSQVGSNVDNALLLAGIWWKSLYNIFGNKYSNFSPRQSLATWSTGFCSGTEQCWHACQGISCVINNPVYCWHSSPSDTRARPKHVWQWWSFMK